MSRLLAAARSQQDAAELQISLRDKMHDLPVGAGVDVPQEGWQSQIERPQKGLTTA